MGYEGLGLGWVKGKVRITLPPLFRQLGMLVKRLFIQNILHPLYQMIYFLKERYVMLERDLATLYNVETRVLNQAVKRNINRFPLNYCFQMSDPEFLDWKSQFVISNSSKMGLRKRPFAFIE